MSDQLKQLFRQLDSNRTKPYKPQNTTPKSVKAILEKGFPVPKCVNAGCDHFVAVRDVKNSSLKSECNTCINARKDGVIIVGVKQHKKTFCENPECPCDLSYWDGSAAKNSALDLDHVNGDHTDNSPENIITICKICHAVKTHNNNDANSKKPSGRRNV